MKKLVTILGLVTVMALALVIGKRMKKPEIASAYTIGILQTASHPALDAVRDGFMEELKNSLGADVSFIVQNAQGSVSQAHSIAQQFHANRSLSGILAIATPAVQAVSAVEKIKPVFIVAVTDPQALGLVYEGTNICGVTDMINVPAEVDMLAQLLPTAKTVGLLYSSGETNSRVMAQQMREALQRHELMVTDFVMSSESDVQAMTELACRRADVLLAPTDNMVASTIALSSAITRKNKKPFIVSDNMLVVSGPLAARGIDYKASGRQAARVASKVLVDQIKPYALPIEQAESREVFINQTTLNLLDLTVPESLQHDVVLVS